MSSATEGSVQVGTSTGTITVPVGIAGINAFGTSEWWHRALAAPESGSAHRRTIDEPGAGVVVAIDDDRLSGVSSVVMITRPLVDWLPGAGGSETPELIRCLTDWADQVLCWTPVAPIQMIITRQDPRAVGDLIDAATGRRPGADLIGPPSAGAAADFAGAIATRLDERRTATSELDVARSRTAIAAVAVGTERPDRAYDAALRTASIDTRDRLISGGIQVHGPRTGLLWPDPSATELPLEVAAEAALEVLLAAVDEAAPLSEESPDFQSGAAQRRELQQRLRAARADLGRRRADPRNLKRVWTRSLIKRLALGRQGGRHGG